MKYLFIIFYTLQSLNITAQKRFEIIAGYSFNKTSLIVENSTFFGQADSNNSFGNQVGGVLKLRVYKKWYLCTGYFSINKQYSFDKLQPFSNEYQNSRVNKSVSGFEIPILISHRMDVKNSPLFIDYSIGLCFEAIRKYKETVFSNSGQQVIGYYENAVFSRNFIQSKISINYRIPNSMYISIEPFFNLDRSLFTKLISDSFIINNSGISFNVGISL